MSVMDKFLVYVDRIKGELEDNHGTITDSIKNEAAELLDIINVIDNCKILLSKILQTRVGDKIIENYYSLPGLNHVIRYYVDEEERERS